LTHYSINRINSAGFRRSLPLAGHKYMFHVKKMASEDFEFASQLTDMMNWDLIEEDFEFMRRFEPDGCFVLLCESERIGIATTISYGQVGWLGNVIVRENHRRRGGGSLLVRHAVEYLTSKGVETIGLYAYLETIPFYVKHDFQYDSKFVVLKGRGFPASTKAHLREAEKADLQQIVDLDHLYFGASRRKLLEPIILDPGNLCYVYSDDVRIFGFAAAKVYNGIAEIGPLVCRRGYDDVAIDLLKAILNKLKDYEVSICMPEKESNIFNLLTRYGFQEDFQLARMFYGRPIVNNFIYVAESIERG